MKTYSSENNFRTNDSCDIHMSKSYMPSSGSNIHNTEYDSRIPAAENSIRPTFFMQNKKKSVERK